MKSVDKFSLKSRATSLKYAFKGVKKLITREHNSRIHLLATILVIIAGFLMEISLQEWVSIIIVIGMVFMAELFNTAIERLSDIVDASRNDLIGQVKDYAAGAVLFSAITSILVGGIIFIPKIVDLFKT